MTLQKKKKKKKKGFADRPTLFFSAREPETHLLFFFWPYNCAFLSRDQSHEVKSRSQAQGQDQVVKVIHPTIHIPGLKLYLL